jgi:hypothetical protein
MSTAIKRDRRKLTKKTGIALGHDWESQTGEPVYLDISKGRFVPIVEQPDTEESAA